MSVDTSTTTTLDRVSGTLGTAMMLAWILGIGIGSFALLLGLTYAMVFGNLALGVICSILLFAPIVITILWGMVTATEAIRAKLGRASSSSTTELDGARPGLSHTQSGVLGN